MKPRVRDAEATRARILKAAVREFARHGYGGARGERVAKAARSSERMVYYYFSNKEGLFRASLESVYASLRDAERALQLDDTDPMQALEDFCRFVWNYYHQHPEFIGLVNTENLQQARHLRRSPRLGELVSPVVGMLAELVERGQRAGRMRNDIDPAQLYVAIASLGYFYLSNQHTLSAVLGHDLVAPDHLQAYWRSAAEMIRRHVAL